MEKRFIMHIDLDSFFVSVERLKDPSLVGKPVIIGHPEGRGVVSSCSYEARAYGVRSAMPGFKAKRLCPHAIFVYSGMADYSAYSKRVMEIVAAEAPLYEQASIDEFFVDLTGMDVHYDCWEWALQLKQSIKEKVGLPSTFGLASSKTVAKMATNEAKPDGQLFIKHGEEKAFLAPMPVGNIPMLGKKAQEVLHQMGIFRISDLQKFPQAHLEQAFGKHGKSIWRKANGICTSEVKPYRERKSISSERTFGQDTNDQEFLESTLVRLAEKVAYQLRKKKKVTSCVAIKVRHSNFETFTRQEVIPFTSSDKPIFEKALQIFRAFYDGHTSIRLIGVKVSNLEHEFHQAGLFEDTAKDLRLNQAIDGIKDKFGGKLLMRGKGMSGEGKK